MANAIVVDGLCFIAITGASQGIGRAVAIECSKRASPGSTLLLTARNLKGLEKTESLIDRKDLKIILRSLDLSTVTKRATDELFSEAIKDSDVEKFDLIMVVHNAGSTGDLSISADRVQDQDASAWRNNYDVNVFNVAVLNCSFLAVFKGHEKRTVIVNVTSLCGIQPFAGLLVYCSGKAAREMYFRVLAEERPDLKVLNYSPGPVRTAMVQNITENAANLTLKEMFVTSQRENKLLEPEQTVTKMFQVLYEGKYKSGDHVDYYD